MITVILNGYRRPHVLEEQYNAIKNQTLNEIDGIMLWCNFDEESMSKYPAHVVQNCTAAFCNQNLGVWARFSYALNSFSKYICMIDDDTIPGSKWLQNCVDTMQTHRGVLGCRGVRMTGDDYLNYPGCQYESFGASNPNEQVEAVDIMGHCWFFEREWLRAYWAESPSSRLTSGGEDMHMSYVVQKHLGLYTYVPPHPKDDKEMWGSLDPNTHGEDMVATSRTGEGHMQAHAYWNYIIKNGYTLVKDRK
jgi:hypothetical protein